MQSAYALMHKVHGPWQHGNDQNVIQSKVLMRPCLKSRHKLSSAGVPKSASTLQEVSDRCLTRTAALKHSDGQNQTKNNILMPYCMQGQAVNSLGIRKL